MAIDHPASHSETENAVLGCSDCPVGPGHAGAPPPDDCPVIPLRAAIIRAESLLREREDLIREYQHLNKLLAWQREAAQRVAHLTPRQHEIMDLVLVGTPSKNIAADLHISQRTVENHRAAIMRKTGSKCLPALARLGFAAALEDDRESVVRGE